MPEVKVNADGFSWLAPNPVPNQPHVVRTAFFGEVVDMPEEEVARGRAIRIARHYPTPEPPGTVLLMEPALVDPGTETTSERDRKRADADAEITELRQRLARLEATRPPAVAATHGVAEAVVLSPATTGVRLLPDEEDLSDPAIAAAAGVPVPQVSEEDLEQAREAERAALEGKGGGRRTGGRGGETKTPTGPSAAGRVPGTASAEEASAPGGRKA
ncbi:MAG: hypothetical protein LC798_21500 [Chloroflexi bacterium]|nr:hypothetical protein [Chloroflexota bacterium]